MKNPVNTFSMVLKSKSVNESFARGAVGLFISPLDPTLEELSDIRTVISEAVTNCIVHAYSETSGNIYLNVSYDSERIIRIRIRDKGCGIEDIEQAKMPFFTTDTEGERGGMGLVIMDNFMDTMKIRSRVGKGTVVTMTKKLS